MTSLARLPNSPPLAATALRGFAWQGLAFVLGRAIMLAATIVVARIVGPAEFGLVTLALVLVTYLSIGADLGVSQALIYLPPEERRTDVALTCAIASSVLLAGILALTAPLVTTALGHPESGPLLQLLSVVLVLTAVGHVPDALLRRDLQFRKRLPAELARGVGRGVVAIGLVLVGLGPWSLVWGEIAGAAAYAVVSWILVPHRPRLSRMRLDIRDLRPLLAFGSPTVANGILATLVLNVDYLIVGSMMGAAALGWYVIGFRIPELLVVSVFQVVSQVTFPVYRRVRDEPVRLRSGYLASFRLQATYGLAMGAVLAVEAPLIVTVLFGDRWQPAVPVMQAIAVYAAFRALSAGAIDLFKAIGRPGLGVWLGVCRLLLLVPLLILATRWGLAGVGWTQAAIALLFTIVMQGVACKLVDISLATALAALRPGLVAAAAASAGAYLGGYVIPGSPLANLVLACVLAAISGAIVLAVTDRHLLRRVMHA